MKKFSFIKQLFTCVSVAFLLSACDKEEDFDEIYGSGSPLDENIMSLANTQYEYNEKGLVTKIIRIDNQYDGENTTTELVTVATISYPQSDRAVLVYTGDYMTTTYTFAFGENHFANRVIESDADGETSMIKFSYDNKGHVTSIDDGCDYLKMEWTNGNLTKIEEPEEYDSKAVLTYGDQTDFSRYNMSPFLLNVKLGPFMNDINWWYERGLYYALHIGFLGKPCRNLPATIVSYDNQNSEPELGTFHYEYLDFGDLSFGRWYIAYEWN